MLPQIWNYANITTSATTTVKTGRGILHAIIVSYGGATNPAITIYDNTSAAGTTIGTFTVPTIGSYYYDVPFTTGLTIVTAGTTPVNITVTYQ